MGDVRAAALQPFAYALLDSLDASVAVLDARGGIVAVNAAWRRFALDNGGAEAACCEGADYVAACEAAGRAGDEPAAAMLAGLRAILDGSRERFALEYPCHSPDERRWFSARLTRFEHLGLHYVAAAHEDITGRVLAEESLREAEATLRKVLEALPVGVWIMDRAGTIVQGNTAGKRIWAGALYVGPERFGEYKGWWLDSGRRIAADEWAAARAITRGETSIDEEVRIECFDGTGKVILNSAVPLRDAAGAVAGAIIVNQDISARKRVEAELLQAKAAIEAINGDLQEVLARERRNARTDELTGVHNRRHFFELAEQAFAVAQRYGAPLSVMMFDIDHFKRVNDELGHQAGDAILREVAGIAREHTRAADILARYGGEEFIVALPGTPAEECLAAAENLRTRIAAGRLGVAGVAVTISAGVAERTAAGEGLDGLIARADAALYEAKRAGRNCSRVSVAKAP